jgi:hypothetical protein
MAAAVIRGKTVEMSFVNSFQSKNHHTKQDSAVMTPFLMVSFRFDFFFDFFFKNEFAKVKSSFLCKSPTNARNFCVCS